MRSKTTLTPAGKAQLFDAMGECGPAPGSAISVDADGPYLNFDGLRLSKEGSAGDGRLIVSYLRAGMSVAVMPTAGVCRLDSGDVLQIDGVEGRMRIGLDDLDWPKPKPTSKPSGPVPASTPSWLAQLISKLLGERQHTAVLRGH